jgi:hypothetical protein
VVDIHKRCSTWDAGAPILRMELKRAPRDEASGWTATRLALHRPSCLTNPPYSERHQPHSAWYTKVNYCFWPRAARHFRVGAWATARSGWPGCICCICICSHLLGRLVARCGIVDVEQDGHVNLIPSWRLASSPPTSTLDLGTIQHSRPRHLVPVVSTTEYNSTLVFFIVVVVAVDD